MRELYERAKSKNRTVLTIIGNDILTNSKRVVTFGHPINARGKFAGIIIWESDIEKIFERHLVPKSFQSSSLPFMEIVYPKKQDEIFQSDLLFRVNINDDHYEKMHSLRPLENIHEQ